MNASDIERMVGGKPDTVSLGDLLARACGTRQAAWQDLPDSPGIYAVCLPGWEAHAFTADAGRARHAEPADPDLLRKKRDRILGAKPTDILYIGRAGNLRKRVRQLARFGAGRDRARNHKGGEWLWQLEGIDEAEVRMWRCPSGRPKALEGKLLERFWADHKDWPLANRRGEKAECVR